MEGAVTSSRRGKYMPRLLAAKAKNIARRTRVKTGAPNVDELSVFIAEHL
jgi:hypothetical protein